MARIRTIKPEFFTSLTIADLSLHARLTFIGLWTHVDDAGRCVDDARLIKAAVWPLDDRVSADIEADLRELSEASLIVRYEVGERSYLAVRTWDEHQRINRATPSKLPPPPKTPPGRPPGGRRPADVPDEPVEPPAQETPEPAVTHTSSTAHAQLTEDSPQERKGKEGNREGKGREGEAPPAPTAREARGPRATRIPDDFAVTPAMRAWHRAKTPTVDIETETEQFRDYWRGKSGKDATKVDWESTWRTWMRKAHAWKAERINNGSRTTGANRHVDTGRDNPFSGGANATYASRSAQ